MLLHSKAAAKQYFIQHDIDKLFQDMVFELTLNQPVDPKRHMYEYLGRALGENSPSSLVADDPARLCSFRMYVEHTNIHGRTGRHLFRKAAREEFSASVSAAWYQEANLLLQELFQIDDQNPRTPMQVEKG